MPIQEERIPPFHAAIALKRAVIQFTIRGGTLIPCIMTGIAKVDFTSFYDYPAQLSQAMDTFNTDASRGTGDDED